eukprot:6222521-Ditylum_brightwellii.AAC.1
MSFVLRFVLMRGGLSGVCWSSLRNSRVILTKGGYWWDGGWGSTCLTEVLHMLLKQRFIYFPFDDNSAPADNVQEGILPLCILENQGVCKYFFPPWSFH